jgi:Zn-dependent protease
VFDADMIFRIPALLMALTIHEYAHARAAVAMGDPTPRLYGRLTLNPVAHLDPLGLLMLWLFKFGWAKPVPINAANFKDWRKGTILVSLAGPLSNIALAFVTAFSMALIQKFGYKPDYAVWKTASLLYTYNVVFAIFNLVPIPPLDGSKVLMGFLPTRHADAFERIEQYGPFILIAMVYLGVVGAITGPIEAGLSQLMFVIIYAVL